MDCDTLLSSTVKIRTKFGGEKQLYFGHDTSKKGTRLLISKTEDAKLLS